MADQSKPEKLKALQDLDREEFLERVLLLLLKRMGYEQITYQHPEGRNLDAMLRYEDRFGETIHAFLLAKLPAISSGNLDIQDEILANFERTFVDEQGKEFKPKECIIATSGKIDDEVVQAIRRFSSEHHYDIRLLDGEKLPQFAEKYGQEWVSWQEDEVKHALVQLMQRSVSHNIHSLIHWIDLPFRLSKPTLEQTLSILKKLEKFTNRDYQQVKEFFRRAGFSISDEIDPILLSVRSDNPALKRYGTIAVELLHHGKLTSKSIQEFYEYCMSQCVAKNGLAFITVPPQIDTAAALQMFVHRSESGFTIVPFTIYAIEQALYEDRCLKTVIDTIKLWKGEADLFGLSTPIRDPLWFIGREKVMDEIAEYIQSLQFVGIWGLRKVGKTSLLYQLMRKRG